MDEGLELAQSACLAMEILRDGRAGHSVFTVCGLGFDVLEVAGISLNISVSIPKADENT